MSGDWWEPPVAGTDEEHLLAVLERLRATFRWKADGLDRAGLDVRIGASALTLGGLLKHLAVAEDHQFGVKVTGEPLGPPWDEVDWATVGHDWPFSSAADDEPGTLYALYDAAVERSRQRVRAALEADDRRLDQPVHISDGRGNHASLRRVVCDMIEEYGRHTGHADLLREAVDGLVGEDPPSGWRPSS